MFAMRKRCGSTVVGPDGAGSGTAGIAATATPAASSVGVLALVGRVHEILLFRQIGNPIPTTESSAYNEPWRKLATAQDEAMKIGELAKAAHTQVETIRYYEREGLLPETARTDGNYRMYAEEHVDRLSFIRHCRGLDMTLDEIRVLLRFKDAPHENCAQVNDLLDEHIDQMWLPASRNSKALERQPGRPAGKLPGIPAGQPVRHL
jgi:Cd(II)/Pb(II)-responsive transcriptional regulator